jgi:hypothetical protein
VPAVARPGGERRPRNEAMVARARKAMAIALTVLDDQGNPPTT